MMSEDDYGQAFHDGETTGAAEERRAIVMWLRRENMASCTGRILASAIERGDHLRMQPAQHDRKDSR